MIDSLDVISIMFTFIITSCSLQNEGTLLYTLNQHDRWVVSHDFRGLNSVFKLLNRVDWSFPVGQVCDGLCLFPHGPSHRHRLHGQNCQYLEGRGRLRSSGWVPELWKPIHTAFQSNIYNEYGSFLLYGTF